MKIGIITFEKYEGRSNIGSSKIRAQWLINHWPEAEIFVQGQKYNVVIYQKAYWVDHAKNFDGVKILDICDPDFLHWGYRTKEMIEVVDAITCSSEELVNTYKAFTDKPVWFVPDRVDLDLHKEKKEHKGNLKKVLWYGYYTNFCLLAPTLDFLIKKNLDLIVVSNKPFIPQSNFIGKIYLENIRWKDETLNSDLLKCDVVLNPRQTNGKWKYKSTNKTVIAWSLGLPVATTGTELLSFLTEESRKTEAEKRIQEVKDKYDICLSVKQYQDLIEKIKTSR